MRTIISLAAVAALFATAANAEAIRTSDRDVVSMSVSMAGVDFSDMAQVKAFHQRLASTAVFACDSGMDAFAARQSDAACARQALDEAVASANRPTLSVVHGGKDMIQLAMRSDIH